jgi:hypothetical protein
MAILPLTFNTGNAQATGNLLASGIGVGKSFELKNIKAQSAQLITGSKLFNQTLSEFRYTAIYPKEFTNKNLTVFNKGNWAASPSKFFVNVEPEYSHAIVPKPYWNQNSFTTEDSHNLGYANGARTVLRQCPVIYTGGNIYTISDTTGVRVTNSGELMRIYSANYNASLNFYFDIKTTGLANFADKSWTGYIDLHIITGFRTIDPYKGAFLGGAGAVNAYHVEQRQSGKFTPLSQKYQLPIVIDLKNNQTKIIQDDYYFIYESGLKPKPTILTNQIFRFSQTGFLNLPNKLMGLTFYSTGLNVTSGKVYQEILRKVNRIGEYSNTGLYSGLKFIYPSFSGEAYFSAKPDQKWIEINSPIQNFRWITGFSGFFTANSYNPRSGALQQDLIFKINTQNLLPNSQNTGSSNFLVTSSGDKYLFNGLLDLRGMMPRDNNVYGARTGVYFVEDKVYRFLTTGNNKFIPIGRDYKVYKASNLEIVEVTAKVGWLGSSTQWPPFKNIWHQKPDGVREYVGEQYSFGSREIYWSGNFGVGSFEITEKIIPRYFSGTKNEEWYLYNYKPVNLYTNNPTALYTTGEAEAMGQPPKPAKGSLAEISILNKTFKNNLGVSFYNEQLRISTQPEVATVPWVANKFALSEPDKTRPTFYAGAIPITGCPPSYYFQGKPVFASWNFSTNSSYTGLRLGDGSIQNRIIPLNPQCLLRDQVRTQLNQLERFESNHFFGPQIQLVQGKTYHFIRVGLTDWEITGMPLVFEENIAPTTTTGIYKFYEFPNQIRFNHKTVNRNEYPKYAGGFKAGFFMEGHSPKWRNPKNAIPNPAYEFKKFEYISFVAPTGITGKVINYSISGADRIAGLVQIFPSGYEVFSPIISSTPYNNNLPKIVFSGNIDLYNSDLTKNKITIPVVLSGVNNTDYIKF